MSKFLIVGLGNPGNEYAGTRHNIGFDVLNALVHKHGGTWENDRLAYRANIKFKGNILVCICPTTFMNLSGRAFKYWQVKENVPLEQTLTVVDDLSLPLEKLRLRGSGSHAGHNGLKDIQNILGSDVYPKLRFGIGNNFPKGMQSDFVLGKWHKEDLPLVQHKIQKSVEVIESFITIGLERTMNSVNTSNYKIEL